MDLFIWQIAIDLCYRPTRISIPRYSFSDDHYPQGNDHLYTSRSAYLNSSSVHKATLNLSYG